MQAAPHGTELVRAAQSGDPRAQDRLVADHLPLVYNIVGRAMNGHHDVDDVVQETMLRALDGLGGLRAPDSFRSWLVAIAMNTLRSHWQRQQARYAAGALDDARDLAHPGGDFVDLAVARLQLSGQRRETAEATRWLEPEDSALLSLWWLECAGELSRHEVAAALELTPEHTAVRVQRMKTQLETARVVVRALSAQPLCPALRDGLAAWDGHPSALWRKRIARHARACPHCAGLWHGLVPAEGLLAGLLLVPPAALLLGAVRDGAGLGPVAPTAANGTATVTAHGTATASTAGARGGRARHAAHAAHSAAETAGRGARRRERERRRGRRRAAAAAGLAVAAVTGGAFYLTTGPDAGDPDPAEVTSAAAPDTADGTSLTPDGADPSTTSASPTTSPSARPSSRPPKPSPTRTTTKPAPPRTTAPAPRPTRPTSTAGSGGSGGGTSDPNASEAQQVIDLTNAERAKAGCGPVTANTLLTRAAQGHSDDMAARNFFDHTNPDGADPGDRVTAAGYRWSTYGENIAKGQRTPAEVMDAWMNSPGHRANILNCSFKEIGIGIHDAGGPYWTQVFGAQ
ncbi:sigma-70 family RNA polymerase sigma factor [Streptomyces sp. NPDC048623]|uniref:sigma-70 family RNA polymerase sigma factor n=1 Tax=Streptomyces sp. NPDC048623 TaxID=3155761 RepID=UPI00344530CB